MVLGSAADASLSLPRPGWHFSVLCSVLVDVWRPYLILSCAQITIFPFSIPTLSSNDVCSPPLLKSHRPLLRIDLSHLPPPLTFFRRSIQVLRSKPRCFPLISYKPTIRREISWLAYFPHSPSFFFYKVTLVLLSSFFSISLLRCAKSIFAREQNGPIDVAGVFFPVYPCCWGLFVFFCPSFGGVVLPRHGIGNLLF